MATIINYSTLVQNIKDLIEDDGVELSNYIPTAIDLAEERLYRELDSPDFVSETSAMLTQNVNTFTKPVGLVTEDSVSITIGNSVRQLRKRTKTFMQDYWPDSTSTGVPKYYGDNTHTTFILVPTPDQFYTYTVRYNLKPVKLNATTNVTNYYTDYCKDALFSACLVEMAKFMKAWEQVQIFENQYVTARDSLNIQYMRQRRDGQEAPMNPESPLNTIKHTINTGA